MRKTPALAVVTRGMPAEIATGSATTNDSQWRMRLFFAACLPVRTAVATAVLAVGYAYPDALAAVAVYTGATALGFSYNLWLTLSGRKTRGGFGGPVWWARARYVHILMWSATATAAAMRQAWAGWVLVGDVAIAGAVGVAHFAYGMDV